MKKIVINNKYGGFSISDEAKRKYPALADNTRNIERDDPILIKAVEEMGSERVSGYVANLVIVEIPDDVEWQIEEYDGLEWVAEKHRVWHLSDIL